MIKKALLVLLMLAAMPFQGIAREFSYDNVSRKYPLDSEYFAFEASQKIAKTYRNKSENFILIPVKNDRNQHFIDKFSLFMVRSGFNLNNKSSDGIVLSYTFDFIDKHRAYLRIEMSDGNHIGVVRTLGEVSPFIAPATTATEIKEEAIKEEFVKQETKPVSKKQPAQTALTELQTKTISVQANLPQPKVWFLKQGSLMNQLEEWAKGENWKLVWQANYDLDLNADASFSGDFVNVVEQIFSSLPHKNNGLRIGIYKQNKVIEVIGE